MFEAAADQTNKRSVCWFSWYQDVRSETYRNPMAIRDRWNQLSNLQRRQIAPRNWQRIGLGVSGREIVTKSLREAKKPMQI